MKKAKKSRKEKKLDKKYYKNQKRLMKAQAKKPSVLYKTYAAPSRMSRGEKQGLIAVIALLIIFAAVWFKIAAPSSQKNINSTPKPQATVQTSKPADAPTVNTQTTVPVAQPSVETTQPAQSQTQDAEETTQPQEQTEAKPETSDTDELQTAIDTACAAVNKAKHTDNFTATKDQEIHLELTECSVPGMTKLAKPILERFGKRKVTEFEFKDGVGYDSNEKEDVKASDAIPPTAKDFKLEKDGIKSYEVTKSGDKTKYIFTLIEEHSSLESPVPTYHAMALDYLDMSGIDIAPAEITQADFTYSGATITVEVDSNGNLTYFEEYMPMHTIGAGKLGLTASGTMEGYIDEIWTFNW